MALSSTRSGGVNSRPWQCSETMCACTEKMILALINDSPHIKQYPMDSYKLSFYEFITEYFKFLDNEDFMFMVEAYINTKNLSRFASGEWCHLFKKEYNIVVTLFILYIIYMLFLCCLHFVEIDTI